MEDRRLNLLIAAVVVFVALVVMWDVFRRTLGRPGERGAGGPPVANVVPESLMPRIPPPDSSGVPPTTQLPGTSQAGVRASGSPVGSGGPSYIELMARAETRRQIRASAELTYLNEVVAASGDSMLHRWDNRIIRPVLVYLAAGRAANYQPAFLDEVRGAMRAWEEVVPVRFEVTTDSLDAEVRFRWRVQFDIDRSGQTDLMWDENGHIQGGVVTLATFDPKGQPMGPSEIRLVALHELGHVIGLDHSPDSSDVMFPVATSSSLSRRDIETARLLYRLTPGSLR